jgi:hypothetical protein
VSRRWGSLTPYRNGRRKSAADMQTLIAGNQASKSNNDVWGTTTIEP